MSPVLERIRETTWLAIVTAIVVEFGLYFVVPATYFLATLRTLETATGGLVQPTLVNNLFVLPIVGLVIFGIGRLRPSDVGWQVSAIGPALLVTSASWIGCQAVLALAVPFFEGELAWHEAWGQPGFVVGGLLAFMATAVTEETMFRGFFLPQFYFKASRHCRWGFALIIALVGSQVLFALGHIHPQVIFQGAPGVELLVNQLRLLFDGLVYAAVYLVTRNLFVCVWLHTLYNQPTPLVQVSRGDAQVAWYVCTLVILIAWPLARKYRTRGQAAIASQSR